MVVNGGDGEEWAIHNSSVGGLIPSYPRQASCVLCPLAFWGIDGSLSELRFSLLCVSDPIKVCGRGKKVAPGKKGAPELK